MIADEWTTSKEVKRSWSEHGHMRTDQEIHHMTFITSDDRVAEVIELCATWMEP